MSTFDDLQVAVKRAERASQKARAALEERDRLVCLAVAEGARMATVARAGGLDVENVRRIVRKGQTAQEDKT